MDINPIAATGFGLAADSYERSRPDYPDAAVRHLAAELGIGPQSHVVELGAGTGKFTQALELTGAEIVAVEPIEAMRETLARLLPRVKLLDGTAEAIPLGDSSADSVVAAQAFHWFRGEATLVEIHRVLKPGGGLGLIWNLRDESVGWVRKLGQIIASYESSIPSYKSAQWRAPFEENGRFTPLQSARFPHVHHNSPDSIVDRAASISFIAALPDRERAAVLEKVRHLLQTDPQTRERTEIDFPYQTDVYWCHKR